MDRRKSILNVSVSVGFKIITMIMAIVVKCMLIRTCGNEVNGLNALYLSIIGFLSVAELGVGSAIIFCMYKPIVDGDNEKVSALYQLFRQSYLLIGGIILTAGLVLTPFIHHFAKDYTEIDVDLYSTFALMLFSVVITYAFSAKTSLINAYKNNYITTAITSGGIVFQYVLQISVLAISGSFNAYLACRIAAVLAQWGVTEIIVRKRHRNILAIHHKLDSETKRNVGKNVKAMFMHKIGTLLVNTVDSMVISAFVGVAALGRYSNYTMILSSMSGILSMIFSSLTSVLGHLYAKEKENTRQYCEAFHMLNFVIGTVFFIGYYAIVDNLIGLLFSVDLIDTRSVAFVITLNGFVQFMRTSTMVFREATGTFYNDRWKPLFEGAVNIILSILLVRSIGVTGVIVATVITSLLICHIVEPFVLYQNAFSISPVGYYVRNYAYIAAFAVGMLLMEHFMVESKELLQGLLINGSISVGISAVICGAAVVFAGKKSGNILRILRRKG